MGLVVALPHRTTILDRPPKQGNIRYENRSSGNHPWIPRRKIALDSPPKQGNIRYESTNLGSHSWNPHLPGGNYPLS
jgi:hypothetical protein